MSGDGLLGDYDAETSTFSFTKVDQDRDSKRNPIDSVTVQGITADGEPFGKARIPLDEEGQVVISEDTFGDDAELAWLVANLLEEEEGWDYVSS